MPSYKTMLKANLQTRHIGSGQPLLTQGILNSISINIPQKQTIEQFWTVWNLTFLTRIRKLQLK